MQRLVSDGLAAAQAAQLLRSGEPEERTAPPAAALLDDEAANLADSLDGLDEPAANSALDRLFSAYTIEAVLQRVVIPYLQRLGQRWATGEVSVGQEHFASSLIRGRLLGLARGWGAGDGPSLLLACPPGEEHDLGLIMFGIAAWRRGWRITYLGQDTPIATIEQAVDVVKPALVVLAIAEGTLIGSHTHELRMLASRVPVAVGGGVRSEESAGLGFRLLEGDPVDAARTLTA